MALNIRNLPGQLIGEADGCLALSPPFGVAFGVAKHMLPRLPTLVLNRSSEVRPHTGDSERERHSQDGEFGERGFGGGLGIGDVVHGQTLRGGVSNPHDSASGAVAKTARLRAFDLRRLNPWPVATVIACFAVWWFAVYFIAWALSAVAS